MYLVRTNWFAPARGCRPGGSRIRYPGHRTAVDIEMRWASQRGPLSTAMLPCCPVFVGHMHNDVGGTVHGLAVISRDLPKEERLFCTRQKHPPTKGLPAPGPVQQLDFREQYADV